MTDLAELGAIAPRAVWAGVTARIVRGERITLAVVELEPDGLVPEHRHPHEQLGIDVLTPVREVNPAAPRRGR